MLGNSILLFLFVFGLTFCALRYLCLPEVVDFSSIIFSRDLKKSVCTYFILQHGLFHIHHILITQ